MPRADIVVSSKIERSPRVMQLEGLFDVPPTQRTEQRWIVCLPLEEKPWNIGLIVGPSGSGKSTILREMFQSSLRDYSWKQDASIVDSFPQSMSIKTIVELLSSVGFSSPPSWLKSFRILSSGEQFRVSLARILAEAPDLAICDEFTSTVDRTVAQIGSAAIARTVRKMSKQIIVATCHEDVEAWLQPDWAYRPAENSFTWRSLRRHPKIKLKIFRTHYSAWELFRKHHYLDSSLNKSAICFLAMYQNMIVAFSAWLSLVSGSSRGKREHRTVVLPDFQGVGIGNAISEYCASIWRTLHYRAFSTTSHPAMIAHRTKSENWKLNRPPSMGAHGGRIWRERSISDKAAISRLTAGFEYVGPSMNFETAQKLLSE